MSDSSNICLSCGICCDGTLIGFVELAQEELPRLKKLMEIEESDGHGLILHPCKSFCEKCTIYDDRPKKCDEFNCGLLKSVQKKEVAFDAAEQVIFEVKKQKVALEKRIAALPFALKSKSFYFRMAELSTLFQKKTPEPSLAQKQPELLSELKQLDRMISENFGVSLYQQSNSID